jgi:hypothetical protein
MQDEPITYGTQNRIYQPAIAVEVVVTDEKRIELVASIGAPKGERIPPHPLATKRAIHMDQSVASDLLKQLRETFQRMGWPLPT